MSSSPRVVLVTGCTEGGIGFELCEEFAEHGCTVYATARRLEAMKGFTHTNIKTMVLDVCNDDEVEKVVKHIVDVEERIDILVNNAGALCAGALVDVSLERAIAAFNVNTFGVLRTCRTVIPHMAKNKTGTIVNIGSVVGDMPTPWNSIYCAAKAATHSLTQSLWMECKPLNINVVLVAPGTVQSNIADNQRRTFSMPENSLYKSYLDNIIDRIVSSQDWSSMPTKRFAKKVAKASLSSRPPRYLMYGGRTFIFSLFAWIPRFIALSLLWWRFGVLKNVPRWL
ncbi:oxidoreductase [Abortiporus biennis]|nr:oxidoreductase [Abortiporus biennis]